MTELKFASYEELLEHLRTCHHWYTSKPEGQYDLVGVTHLFLACLDNLRANAPYIELKEITDCFEEDQKEFFGQLCRKLQLVPNGS